MQTVVVLNGEDDWGERLARRGLHVEPRRIQDCSWVLRDGLLHVVDRTSTVVANAVLWRVGAIRMLPRYRNVIDLIRLAGVPSVNSGAVLARCYDRLATAAEMRVAGLPIIPANVAIGDGLARRVERPRPFVVKAGNYHGGWGKTLIREETDWKELSDLLFPVDDYVVAEPFIEYVRDVRCLAIGDRLWAMSRRGRGWRANVDTSAHALMAVPEQLAEWTRAAMRHLGADVLGLDFVETRDGTWWLLECNDTPGFGGFPDEVHEALVDQLVTSVASDEKLRRGGAGETS